jgi:hypothetical protein
MEASVAIRMMVIFLFVGALVTLGIASFAGGGLARTSGCERGDGSRRLQARRPLLYLDDGAPSSYAAKEASNQRSPP